MIQGYVISKENVAWFEIYIDKLERMKMFFAIDWVFFWGELRSNHFTKGDFDVGVKISL